MKYEIYQACDDWGLGFAVFTPDFNRVSDVFDTIEECEDFIESLNKAKVINEIGSLLWNIPLDDLLEMQKQIFDDMYESDIKDLLS